MSLPSRTLVDERMVEALPPGACAIYAAAVGRLDPADSYIAWADGLTPTQARSRARNANRSFGTSWPDHLQGHDVTDLAEANEIQHQCGLHSTNPLDLLEALESVHRAMTARDAADKELAACWAEAHTKQLAQMFSVTPRRAQQIKKDALAADAAGQGDLFGGDL